MATKKLYRSKDKVFSGVLGGIGEYFDIDATILRLGFILVAIVTGVVPAIIGYLIAVLVVPQKPENDFQEATYTEVKKDEPVKEETVKEEKTETTTETKETETKE